MLLGCFLRDLGGFGWIYELSYDYMIFLKTCLGGGWCFVFGWGRWWDVLGDGFSGLGRGFGVGLGLII